MHHPAKRKVVCAGRRFGKTHLAASIGCEKMIAGRRVVFASTTQDQVDTFWELAKEWLRPMIEARLIYKNESKRLMVFNYNGGRIKAKTAWNADTMRGDYGDFIVLDEFAQMHPGVWDYVVSPMMLDTDGDCWFISTPLLRNHFFQMYQKGLADDTGRWACFHATSYDNPYLNQDALTEITADMSESAYQQEIMAEFLEGAGAVFRNIRACLYEPDADITPESVRGHYVVCGIDWGKQKDSTVISVFDATTGREVDFDRFNQIDYTFQCERVGALMTKWGVQQALVELNSIGVPNFEALERANLPVVGFNTTSSSKPPLIESLSLAFEREEALWLDIPVATGELEAFERKVSAATGRSSYNAPAGLHDDSVVARALAWWAVLNRPQSHLQFARGQGLYASMDDHAQQPRRAQPDAAPVGTRTRHARGTGQQTEHSVFTRGRREKARPGG